MDTFCCVTHVERLYVLLYKTVLINVIADLYNAGVAPV